MQECVSYKIKRKPMQNKLISIISIVLFFLFLIFVLFVLVALKKGDKCFEKQTYYFVYVEKSKVIKDKSKQDLVKNLGGAGIYYFHNQKYCLLANVYLLEEDANEIKNGLTESFSYSDVLKIDVKEIPKNKQRVIKDNLSYYRFFKYINSISNDFFDLQMNYITGKLSEGKVLSNLIKKKLELEDIIKEFENNENLELFDNIKTYASMMKLLFEDFFDNFYQSTKKQSMLCELVVNFALAKVDLFDNLQ